MKLKFTGNVKRLRRNNEVEMIGFIENNAIAVYHVEEDKYDIYTPKDLQDKFEILTFGYTPQGALVIVFYVQATNVIRIDRLINGELVMEANYISTNNIEADLSVESSYTSIIDYINHPQQSSAIIYNITDRDVKTSHVIPMGYRETQKDLHIEEIGSCIYNISGSYVQGSNIKGKLNSSLTMGGFYTGNDKKSIYTLNKNGTLTVYDISPEAESVDPIIDRYTVPYIIEYAQTVQVIQHLPSSYSNECFIVLADTLLGTFVVLLEYNKETKILRDKCIKKIRGFAREEDEVYDNEYKKIYFINDGMYSLVSHGDTQYVVCNGICDFSIYEVSGNLPAGTLIKFDKSSVTVYDDGRLYKSAVYKIDELIC